MLSWCKKNSIRIYMEICLKDLEDNTIRDGSKLLDVANRLSLLAMVAYSYKNDVDLEGWLEEYASKHNTYNPNQKNNFLNMVDEADLLALMDEDAVNEYIAAKDAKDTEPAVTETPELTEEPAEPEDTKEEEPKKNSSGALIIVLILTLGGAGGYLYFTKFKGKKPQKETVDPDADYTEEDDDYLDNLADEVDEIMTEDEETEDSRLIKFDESDSDADDSGDEE